MKYRKTKERWRWHTLISAVKAWLGWHVTQDLSHHAVYSGYWAKSWWLQFYKVKCYTTAYWKKRCLYLSVFIYIFIFLTNIYNFLHCLSSFKPGWKVEKRPPINMHGQINYRNGSRGEKIWISWDICATGKIIPNSNQVEWSNQQNTHC